MDRFTARIKEQSALLKIVRSWEDRIRRLKTRRKNPMSEAAFCRKYGFRPEIFNRAKTGATFPRKKTIEKFEAALKKEGV